MKFIGVDFGWVSGNSGLCCLQLQNDRLQILEVTTKLEISEVFTWIDRWVSPQESAIIGVDAPTIIPNQTGMRVPDKLTHKHFGKYHAGCYPASLSRSYASRTVSFGNKLTERGFNHAAQIIPQKLGRYQIEVFPHPAMVHLFGLNKILKYKKGRLAQKVAELKRLRKYIIQTLPQIEPRLHLEKNSALPSIPHLITGKTLKSIEDRLDSLICAYISAYWWYWGEAKNLVLGDETTGYIVVPNRC